MANHLEIATTLRSFDPKRAGSQTSNLPFRPPPELQAWLELELLPATLPWYGEGMYLTSVDTVVQAQLGYAVLGDGKPAKGWPHDWVVIGDVSSDPVIANPAIEGTPVLYAVHGTGKWVGEMLAPTLESVAKGLALWLTAIGEEKSALEDSVLRAPVETAVRNQIVNLVGSDCLPLWLGHRWLD